QWMGDEKFRDRFRLFCGHHEIEIVYNFFSAPITPRNTDLESVGMPREIAPHRFRFAGDLPELKVTGGFSSFLDRLADLCLCGFAKAGQFRDAACFACLAQLLDRADLQLLVERLDLFRAQ